MTEGIAARDGVDGHGPKFLSHAARINMAERGRVNITPYHSFIDEVELYRVHHWQCNKCSRLIKRAMNRAPAPRDPWWPRHQMACGGEFVKVKEPEKKKKWKRPKKFFGAYGVDPSDKNLPKPPPGVMLTRRVEDMLCAKPKTVACPVCSMQIVERLMNQHLDECLAPNMFSQDPTPTDPSSKALIEPKVQSEGPKFVPLSGQLYKERHFGSGSASRSGAGAGTSAKRGSGGKTLGSASDVGEFNSNAKISLPHSAGARFRAASIDQNSVASALQVLFGGTDALMGYAIGGDPILPFEPIVSGVVKKPRLLSDLMSEAVNGEKDVQIGPVDADRTPQELIQEVQIRFGVCGQGLTDSNIEASSMGDAKAENVVGESTNFVQPEMRHSTDKLDFLGREMPVVNEQFRKKPNNPWPLHPLRDAVPQVEANLSKPNSSALARAVSPPVPSNVRNRNSSSAGSTGTKVLSSILNSRPPSAEGPSIAPNPNDSIRSSSVINLPFRDVASQPRMSACPLCDEKMPRADLDRHVSVCLAQTGFEPEFVISDAPRISSEPDNTRKECHIPNETRQNYTNSSNFRNPRPAKGTAACPICDAQINRNDLESHTAICMTSTGIMDAFS